MEFHEQVEKLTQDDIPFVKLPISQFMPDGWAKDCKTLQRASEKVWESGYEPTVYHHDLEDLRVDIEDKKKELADDLDTTVEVVEKFEDSLKSWVERALADAEMNNFVSDYMDKVVSAVADAAYSARRWPGVNAESVVNEVIQKYNDGSEVSLYGSDPNDVRYDYEYLWFQFKLEAVQEELQDWINDSHVDPDEIDEELIFEVCDEIAADLEWDDYSDENFWGRHYTADFDDWGVHYADYGYHKAKAEIESYLDEETTLELSFIIQLKPDTKVKDILDSKLNSIHPRKEDENRIEADATIRFQDTRRNMLENLQRTIFCQLESVEHKFGDPIEIWNLSDKENTIERTEQDL